MKSKQVGGISVVHLSVVLSLLLFVSCRITPPDSKTVQQVIETFVLDETSTLKHTTVDSINQRLREFEQASSVEILVFICDSLRGMSSFDKSMAIAKQYPVGKPDIHNGLILLIAPYDRKIELRTGRGMEDVMNDKECRNIIDSSLQYLRNDDYKSAIDYIISRAITANDTVDWASKLPRE